MYFNQKRNTLILELLFGLIPILILGIVCAVLLGAFVVNMMEMLFGDSRPIFHVSQLLMIMPVMGVMGAVGFIRALLTRYAQYRGSQLVTLILLSAGLLVVIAVLGWSIGFDGVDVLIVQFLCLLALISGCVNYYKIFFLNEDALPPL